MKNNLLGIDYVIFFLYFALVACYGFWIYRKKKKAVQDTKDFFLAEGALTWWAIGAALIASNISAEQFVGMSAQGFTIGLAISTYEWMAAATLVIVGIFFMPVYLKNKIFTMPQFLENRYNSTVSMIMAVFWLLLYVVVNLTSILYLGAKAVENLSGLNIYYIMIALAICGVIIALGGMKVVGYTSVIQVLFLILGGLATTYIAVDLVSSHLGGHGFWDGFKIMREKAPEHFHMIIRNNVSQQNPNIIFPNFNPYSDLPGLTILIGGMWIVNLNYWGCNQYITQRALGANLNTGRNGLLFAGFLKLLMPLIVVIPGIAAFVLWKEVGGQYKSNMITQELVNSELVQKGFNQDNAYGMLLGFLGPGLRGLSFAALTAAVIASLAAKVNSISTIFTLDLYKKKIKPQATEQELVKVGKITIVIAMILGIILCPFLGFEKGGFRFIQEYTGFVSPGIFAMFILGFFWKKTTSNAALFATVGGFIFSVILKLLPGLGDNALAFLSPLGWSTPVPYGGKDYISNPVGYAYEIPFLDRMGIVFVLCLIGMVIISLWDNRRGHIPKGLEVDTKMFRVTPGFAIGALIICGILAALYIGFW